ncbi:helicase-related protein [Kocuria sp.]|uniref:helicase-related protein n=1 Tax=Kocuria sp. TaxID=1871328 RepID=UPI0028AA07FA|nr:helicase-related protein [Kocuria sp.]
MPSGKKARAQANLDAIEVIRTLERESRYATADEQAVLARYSSWGAVPEIFEDREDWAQLSQRMEQLLSRDEIAQAQITTLNAHYTDPEGAATMWRVLENAGFVSGTVLEPGCGSGNFIGHAPADAQMVGVELDSMTAKVAAALHPQATIRAEGFERTFLPTGGISAAIGNVPFGRTGPFDLKDNADNHSLHNYFIHKTMKHMAPGGYGLFITSSWTMDAKTTKSRRAISDHSDLVAAVRLPGDTFQRVAGTQAQTDVLVFRRRDPSVAPNREAQDAWVLPATETGEIDGEVVAVSTSKFFQQHPEHVMGSTRLAKVGMTQQPGIVVDGETGSALWQRVQSSLDAQVKAAASRGLGFAAEPDPDVSVAALAPGGLVVPGDDVEALYEGQVRVNEGGTVQSLAADHTWQDVPVRRGVSVAEMRALVGLKTQIREVINRQQNREPVEDALQRLTDRYDAYVQAYGPINRFKVVAGKRPSEKAIERAVENKRRKWAEQFDDLSATDRAELQPEDDVLEEWRAEAAEPESDTKAQPHLTFLRTDPDFGKVLGLEVFDEAEQTATKSGYFKPETFATGLGDREAETAEDALAISLDESQRVDLERIAQLLGTDVEGARARLGTAVFDDPDTGELVPATQYLSGDIREKLRAAQAAAVSNSDYEANVEALEQVAPEWVTIESVSIQPGVRFVTAEQYQQFAQDTLGVSMNISELPDGSGWTVDTVPKSKLSARVRFEFGTEKANPTWILGRSMNNTPVTITRAEYVDGKERRVPDQKATALARQKQSALTAAFGQWVVSDPTRKRTIEEQYNNQLNSYVPADYRKLGEQLRLPGLAPDRTPHPYQRSAVARIVNEPAVLLNHVVGAGKTGSMVMGAMELRRTGVARKPLMVVPNHLTDQITREFNQWYPAANVLTFPTGADALTRRRYGAMSAAGDWDAVIVPQSTFSKMTVAPSKQRRWLEDDIEQMKADKQAANGDEGGRLRAKAIAQAIKQAEKRLERIRDHKDVGLSFEETGCDYLFIDEAHNFKNLRRVSAFRELQCAGSDKATDLDYILRTLREMKAERTGSSTEIPSVATFATGTPVSNSLAEQWVMGHYLRPDLMDHFGVASIDAFGSTFTKSKDSIEVKPSGAGFRLVNRVSSFSNVEALMRMTSLYESVVTRDQIPGRLPEISGGKMRPVERDASPHVADYVAELAAEAESPEGAKKLLEILGRARKVALDPRMVGLEPDEDGGRVRAVADEVMRIEGEYRDQEYLDAAGNPSPKRGGLQLLFCDQGTPGGATGFNMYQAIKDELVEQGMHPSRVAFIHDARSDSDRADLFARARRGDLSVLIGSTEKMGTGMNVQDRVTAIHHVDVPWKPSDLEQREGRALRQGNQNRTVEITAMVTAGTFDSYMWQKIGTKSAFLDQLRRGTAGHEIEDIGGLTMSSQEMVAVASGDARVSEWMTLNNQVMELENLKSAEISYQRSMRHGMESGRATIAWLSEYVDSIRGHEDQAPQGEFRMQVGSRAYLNRAEGGRALLAGLRQASVRLREEQSGRFAVARLGGLTVVASFEQAARGAAVHLGFDGVSGISDRVYFDDLLEGKVSDSGLATRLWNRAVGMSETRERMEADLQRAVGEVEEMEEVASDATGFSRQDELEQVTMERDLLGAQLGLDAPDSMTGDAAPADYLSEDEMQKLYRTETPRDVNDLRTGDVVEVPSASEGFSAGMYEVRSLDAGVQQIRPEGSSDDEDWERIGYSVNWTFVRRPRTNITNWEQQVLSAGESDDVKNARQIIRNGQSISAGERVSVRGHRVDESGAVDRSAGLETVTGELVGVDVQRMQPHITVRTEGGQEVTVHASGMNEHPVMIRHDVIDAEDLARQAAEAEARAEADRARILPGRVLPGDVLLTDVENVGRRGWVLNERGGRFIEPSTEAGLGHKGLPSEGFEAEIQQGRNLTDEEMQQVFGADLSNVQAEAIRVGDVVDGQALDSKRGMSGDVVVTWIEGFDPLTFRYRETSEPRWAPVKEAKRKSTTKIGAIKGRRFGALSHLEKLKLGAEADVVQADALTEATVGSWITTRWAPDPKNIYDTEWVVGKLESVTHDAVLPSQFQRPMAPTQMRGTILTLNVEGESIEVPIAGGRREVAVLPGAWPAAGVDFRGVVVGQDATTGATAPDTGPQMLRGLELTDEVEVVGRQGEVLPEPEAETAHSTADVEDTPDEAARDTTAAEDAPSEQPEVEPEVPETAAPEAEPTVEAPGEDPEEQPGAAATAEDQPEAAVEGEAGSNGDETRADQDERPAAEDAAEAPETVPEAPDGEPATEAEATAEEPKAGPEAPEVPEAERPDAAAETEAPGGVSEGEPAPAESTVGTEDTSEPAAQAEVGAAAETEAGESDAEVVPGAQFGFQNGQLWVTGVDDATVAELERMQLRLKNDGTLEPGARWEHRGYLGAAAKILEDHGAQRVADTEASEVPRVGDWVAFELPEGTSGQARAVGSVEAVSERGLTVASSTGGRRWHLDVSPDAEVETLSADHARFVAAARAFKNSLTAEERLRDHGYRLAREIEPGDRVSLDAEVRDVSTPWASEAAGPRRMQDVLVVDSEAGAEGLHLLIYDGESVGLAVCEEDTKVKIEHEASRISKAEARTYRQSTAAAVAVETDTESLEVGEEVRITGTDARTGGTVDEVSGEVVSVTEPEAEAAGEVSVKTSEGDVRVVERGTETVERPQRRMVELVDVADEVGARHDQGWMRAAQVRRGDQVRMPGAQASHPVYEAHKYNGAFVDITAANDQNMLVTARVNANQRLNVERAGGTGAQGQDRKLSQMVSRETRAVRTGDVVHVDGRALAVLGEHYSPQQDMVELHCADTRTGEEELHRAYGHAPIQLQRELALEPRDGIRGAVVPVAARQLRAGMLIRTRSAEPAYVNGAVRSGDRVDVSYQLVGKHQASEPRQLSKQADDPVGVHLPHEQRIERQQTRTARQEQEPQMQQHLRAPGPESGMGMD